MDAKIAEAMKDGRAQKGPLKKTRANQELTRGEVTAIKIGRKKLRRELKAKGIHSKKEFELTASALGLYFDKKKWLPLLLWFLHGRGLAALLAALAALLALLFLFSTVTQMQGHFTINMSEDMFAEGFTLSEEITFANPKSRLFCDPASDVPCFSISDIHLDVNDVDGQHNEAQYFAYTYYIRNEGESVVDYEWSMDLNSESKHLSTAAWVMLFEDDEMTFYAKPREDGTPEALPYFNDNTRGYLEAPFIDYAVSPEAQYQVIAETSSLTYYRVIPESFEADTRIASGYQAQVEPGEKHKYTVVIWLEGDDPDCTDDLIGGHLGMDMSFRLVSKHEEQEEKDSWFTTKWKVFWDNLLYWEEE